MLEREASPKSTIIAALKRAIQIKEAGGIVYRIPDLFLTDNDSEDISILHRALFGKQIPLRVEKINFRIPTSSKKDLDSKLLFLETTPFEELNLQDMGGGNRVVLTVADFNDIKILGNHSNFLHGSRGDKKTSVIFEKMENVEQKPRTISLLGAGFLNLDLQVCEILEKTGCLFKLSLNQDFIIKTSNQIVIPIENPSGIKTSSYKLKRQNPEGYPAQAIYTLVPSEQPERVILSKQDLSPQALIKKLIALQVPENFPLVSALKKAKMEADGRIHITTPVTIALDDPEVGEKPLKSFPETLNTAGYNRQIIIDELFINNTDQKWGHRADIGRFDVGVLNASGNGAKDRMSIINANINTLNIGPNTFVYLSLNQ
ncbi:hypothetical protein COS31_05410 [Candidatus Roizmanbacteria bacterium CG02_land_8_20_14_3_00_36_15]|uniref:Uncharacterized protein n=1 Tax=Candidatus Roizmanbacteria bacterium CG10_big_fil_rev_8_21_14_0_10_36_26 TaxID=1974851 RepID=A0A2M8KMT1_9BACT|nr:MAG: hypothetical protein COS31_05410 [Candidatus Roizmanbacteria bacterium CG02_land_8_20_14_3_00_36_15]PJA52453.1 MAG: hypothetical protein CO166_05820 [Candidatus Roizmanbacteria bacterium CG_4_9_14_3_um_filter_36_11]PJE61236.1 MAG: hypothetical protein COU86_00185 [Candidatus Roizmanbacteria bacterium CG10_big_fil_rev_8_21_14_0_10_36_26]